jgi:hypothetical protein
VLDAAGQTVWHSGQRLCRTDSMANTASTNDALLVAPCALPRHTKH